MPASRDMSRRFRKGRFVRGHLMATGEAGRFLEGIVAELAAAPSVPDERFFHEDLSALDDAALRIERRRVTTAIMLSERRPSRWVLERLKRLDAEIWRRRAL